MSAPLNLSPKPTFAAAIASALSDRCSMLLLKFLGNFLAIGSLVFGITSAALIGKSQGGTIIYAADLAASYAVGAQQNEVVWYEGTVNGNTVHATGILFRGEDSDFVLTPEHAIVFVGGTLAPTQITVGNGTSYKNDRGLESGIISIIFASNFTPGNPWANSDFAFLQLANRITTTDYVNPTFRLSSPADGQSMLFTGFGLPYARDAGALPNTGNVMSFTATFSTSNPSNSADDLYDAGRFFGNPGEGYSRNYDSGSSVKTWNPSTGLYELVGMVVGGDSISYTLMYNFNDSQFRSIMSEVVRPLAPSERSVALTCAVTNGLVELAMVNLVAGRMYRVMRAGNLSNSWIVAYSFQAANSSATWSDSVSPQGRQFYRLEWNE